MRRGAAKPPRSRRGRFDLATPSAIPDDSPCSWRRSVTHRNSRHPPSRILLFRLLLLGFTALFCLLFAELAVRLIAPQPASWLAIYREDPDLPFYSLAPNAVGRMDTGEARWTVYTDEHGHRVAGPGEGSPVSTGSAGDQTDCVNLWIGDSFSFGYGLDYPLTFVGRFEARASRTQTVNASVGGYGPTQYRMTLEQLVGPEEMDFDALYVATYLGNDFNDVLIEKTLPVTNGILGADRSLKSFLKTNFHLYRLVSSVYHRVSSGPRSAYDHMLAELARPEAWRSGPLVEAKQSYASEMERILAIARARDVEPSFVLIPTREAVEAMRATHRGEQPGTDDDPTLPVRHATDILERAGARFVDLTPTLALHDPEETFFRFDGHLNERGSEIAAAAIAAGLPRDCRRRRAHAVSVR